MNEEKKYINKEDNMVIQQYLEEIAKIKLIDRGTLLRLHQNINKDFYSNSKIINSISGVLLDDTKLN